MAMVISGDDMQTEDTAVLHNDDRVTTLLLMVIMMAMVISTMTCREMVQLFCMMVVVMT